MHHSGERDRGVGSRIRADEGGFTLIEAMIAVAIVAVLAAIAMPNYQSYRARGLQAEAKTTLTMMYAAEKGFFAERFSYTSCLRQAGYRMPASTETIYYSAGFLAADPGSTCGPTGAGFCGQFVWTGAGATCSLGTDTAVQANAGMNGLPAGADAIAATSTVTKSTFQINAGGDVGMGAFYDQWFINEDKQLVNNVSGL